MSTPEATNEIKRLKASLFRSTDRGKNLNVNSNKKRSHEIFDKHGMQNNNGLVGRKISPVADGLNKTISISFFRE